MSTESFPQIQDAGALQSLQHILALTWVPLRGEVISEADKALKQSSDVLAKDAIEKAKAAAEAVEAFGERLELLRMDLDELSGGKFGGETVGKIPDSMRAALESAFKRYNAYVASFDADEDWLKKKVQEELGAQMLLVKQRCSGLESEWNEVSLLGTSGLSGSYIEKLRRT